jgi:hypothetical protein
MPTDPIDKETQRAKARAAVRHRRALPAHQVDRQLHGREHQSERQGEPEQSQKPADALVAVVAVQEPTLAGGTIQ